MEINLRSPASPEPIISIMTDLIDRGYRRTDLIVELRHLINPPEFISPPVIIIQNFF